MLFIVLIVVTWIPPILGLGALLRYGGDPYLRRAVTGMLGLGVLALGGMVLNFGLPLSPPVATVAWLTGTVVFWLRRRWLSEGVSRIEVLGSALALAAIVALMQPPWRLYDAGLYYLQAVRWASEQPIAIGVVNLYGPLAYNNCWFVLSALLEHSFASDGASAYFVNILPMLFAACGASAAAARLLRGDNSFSNIAMIAVILPVAHATEGIGAQAPDQALTVIVPFTLVLLARALEPNDGDAVAAMLLGVFAVTIKVSAAPLLLGGAVALARRRNALGRKRLLALTGLLSLCAGLWALRSVLLSGCVVYPAASTCINSLRWTPSPAQVQEEARWIYADARQPGLTPDQVLGSWAWLPAWLEATLSRLDYLILGVMITCALAAMWATRRALTAPLAITISVTLGGILYWFALAPNPRFALGFLFSAALLPFAFAASRVPAAPSRAFRVGTIAAALLMAAVLVFASGVLRIAVLRPWPIPVVARPQLPLTYTSEMATESGLRVSVPVKGDQCWANPVPCTPRFDPKLARDWAFVPADQLEP
ncbi:hypothetical protein [Anaeromyxobacter sp. PSR-1]|uniref:LIC_10190 family membrane protein n=1 Tax=Anaeromyxobacter sp. PSR-1 TaxID=1300915 RepID=UPI000751041D|nr:hypothetical protein [Anaeromyxobacter sp. PSR-1]